MDRAKADLAELVSFQSVADAKQYPPEECAKAADWVVKAFAAEGLQDVTASPTPDGSNCVHGHVPAPDGAPTVLLYCHYDVQPPLGEDAWDTPVFELTSATAAGTGAARRTARATSSCTSPRCARCGRPTAATPCGIKLICEGSEEQGTGGLEAFVPENVELLRADTILVVDTGNFAVGVPTLTTTLRGMTSVDVTLEALGSPMHSGMFGGPAPDPVVGLIQQLASLHDAAGNTTIDGLDNSRTWTGVDYSAEQFRADANVLDGVELMGDGSVADMLWSRLSATVLGIDVPPVIGSSSAVQASAAARVSLRIPNGIGGQEAQDALVAHLESRVPYGMRCTIERVAVGDPFVGSLSGPGYESMRVAMQEAFGHEQTTEGQGGSIPLCNVLAETYPDAEIMLLGVEEPKCLIHAPNESVDPSEIEHTALSEALFLEKYAQAAR
jgi:cysteinylglycine-S-conjugate dipeptidase